MAMTPLEIKRLHLEIKRVDAAKMEMEFKILEREEEIQRLKDGMLVQDKRIAEVTAQLQAAGVTV